MSRRPWRFAPTEIQRAIKLVRAAGLSITKVEIGPDGTITIGTNEPSQNSSVAENGNGEAGSVDDLDRELKEFEARHGEG